MATYSNPSLILLGGLSALCLISCSPSLPSANQDWPMRKADYQSSSYSPLDQINRENVAKLEKAWEYKTGDSILYTIECNPIIIDGVLYASSPMLNAFALDAATGEELWKFVPSEAGPTRRDGQRVNRGLSYWEEGMTNAYSIRPGLTCMQSMLQMEALSNLSEKKVESI